MSTREKILDDVARIAGGAAGVLSDTLKGARGRTRIVIDDMAQRLDLVPREDFERLELMLRSLEKRVNNLEQALAEKQSPQKTTPKAK